MIKVENEKWGYLRETQEKAELEKADPDTGLHKTGLDEYLKVIFPDVDDWVHDKPIGELNGEKCRWRPDYRSETLKMIVEFDGPQHYIDPEKILGDYEKDKQYMKGGYKVVRIPYFIQLTNEAVNVLFGVDCKEPLFNPNIPSMGVKGRNSPAYLCYEGLKRMANDLRKHPKQCEIIINALEGADNEFMTGINVLKTFLREKVQEIPCVSTMG